MARQRQRRLDKDEDKAHAAIATAAEQYSNKLAKRMKAGEAEREARDETIDLMRKHGVEAITLDDGRPLRLVHDEKYKLKIGEKNGEEE